MSSDAKYLSLYYNLMHQNSPEISKQINNGPCGNMSYIPPWVPPGGPGMHYPPHMIPHHHHQVPTSTPPPATMESSPVGSPSHIYQAMSPSGGRPQQNNIPNKGVNHSPKQGQIGMPATSAGNAVSSSVSQAAAAAAAAAVAAVVAATTNSGNMSPSAQLNGDALESYPPLGFSHRPHSSNGKTYAEVKSESGYPPLPPELTIGLPGPSSFDAKAHRKYVRRSPGKHPSPEQLNAPVLYSYQGRGRPRKHFTHGTGLPVMTPVTHPSPAGEDDEDEANKPFRCNLCNKGFKLRGGLQQHERTHSTDRPYICPDCGKLFRQPTHLQQHMRIHTGEKPYDCSFCDKSFRQRTILNQHLRIHTGEKPYICIECGKQFRQKAILDQHYRTHLGEKPYACPHASCRKHFREMASLISHMKCHKDVPDAKTVLQQAKRLIKEEKLEEFAKVDAALAQVGIPPLNVPHPDHPGRYIQTDHLNGRVYPPPQSASTSTPSSSSGGGAGSHKPGLQSPPNEPPPPPPHMHHSPRAALPHESHPIPPPPIMGTPQMSVANLIPYPHSIFPATTYMMTSDSRFSDPRQYPNLQVAQEPVPTRPTH